MAFTKYLVKVSFKYPAWDEKEGFTVETYARSKSEANARVRRQCADDGHRDITVRATEADKEQQS